MYGNFIYFIVGVLIYTTYQSVVEPFLAPIPSLGCLFCTFPLFFAFAFYIFRRFEKNIEIDHNRSHYDQFDSISNKMMILAMSLFTFDIYGLHIKKNFDTVTIFGYMPTLLAIIFLIILIGYFAIVWACSHRVYSRLFKHNVSRSTYVKSQIKFSLPVLIPWVLISIITDILEALPFEQHKEFLETTYGQILYFFIFLSMVAFFAPAMLQRFWGCTPLQDGEYRNQIEAMCQKAGLKYANILYWPIMGGRIMTAGVMGLVRRVRYILVTPALLEMLTVEELNSVIAHEIGHVKRKHLLLYLMFFVGYILFSYCLTDLFKYSIIYNKSLFVMLIKPDDQRFTSVSVIFTISMIVIFIVYFRFIFAFFMRNFERQADLYVFKLIGDATHLISSLAKITVYSGSPADSPNWHHFSVKQRIDYLNKCQDDKTWIQKHDKKIKIGLAIYIFVMMFIIGVSFAINSGTVKNNFDRKYTERLVEVLAEQMPNNPQVYALIGDLALEKKDYLKAIEAYEHSLSILADNPEVLNNISWIYATCEIKQYQNHQKALNYAQKAASLNAAPYILDTLSEAYFVNGLIDEAINIETSILQTENLDKKSYYEEQLNKFKKAKKTENQ